MSHHVYLGDCRQVLGQLPDESADMVITSLPHYGYREHQDEGTIGLESNPEKYVQSLEKVFLALRRVLNPAGVLWIHVRDQNRVDWTNLARRVELGLLNLPLKVAEMAQQQGFILQNVICWSKGVPTGQNGTWLLQNHDQILLLGLNEQIRFNFGPNWPNPGTVWEFPAQRWPDLPFHLLPREAIELMIKLSCPPGGTVLDPFMGSGAVLDAARRLNRTFLGIEVNPIFYQMAKDRLQRPVEMPLSEEDRPPITWFDREIVQ